MNNQQIGAFYLFFFALVIIFSKAYSDEIKHQNATKEYDGIGTSSLISKSSNSVLDKKNVEENLDNKPNDYDTVPILSEKQCHGEFLEIGNIKNCNASKQSVIFFMSLIYSVWNVYLFSILILLLRYNQYI